MISCLSCGGILSRADEESKCSTCEHKAQLDSDDDYRLKAYQAAYARSLRQQEANYGSVVNYQRAALDAEREVRG